MTSLSGRLADAAWLNMSLALHGQLHHFFEAWLLRAEEGLSVTRSLHVDAIGSFGDVRASPAVGTPHGQIRC
jgi:hypothetical protein